MNRFWIMMLSVAAFVGTTGCFTTTVSSGRPAESRPAVVLDGIEAAEFDDRWHHGSVNGMAEANGNYNLRHICPDGWAEVKTEESFLNGLVTFATGLIYAPQSVTIRCARREGEVAVAPRAPVAAQPSPAAQPEPPVQVPEPDPESLF